MIAFVRRARAALLRDLALPEKSATPLDREVRGKVVLITGGSSGIGLATAQRIAAAGAVTVICGRDPGKLADAARAIGPAAAVVTRAANVADLAQVDALVADLTREYGGVDVLINNAGRSIRRTIADSRERFHDYQRTMQLNYFGAVRLTAGLLPAMAQRRAGHVINVSTIGVLMSTPRFAAYVASKAALDAWTGCAAQEYADAGVAFTTVHMPLVKTPMIAPTREYHDVPALTADEAAELIVDAIVRKPVRIATAVGGLSDAIHAVWPAAARQLMRHTFRMAAGDADG